MTKPFKRIARESAVDFFAPITGMYKVFATNLNAMEANARPALATTARVQPYRRAARPAGNKSLSTSAKPKAHTKK